MKYNSQTITLKVDSVRRPLPLGVSQSTSRYDERATERKAKALEILVANGYNEHGRHIDIEKVEKATKRFEELLSEIERLV